MLLGLQEACNSKLLQCVDLFERDSHTLHGKVGCAFGSISASPTS